jgi:hypothetical protein
MIQLVLIALIGVTALAMWAWSRRHRRAKVPFAAESASPGSRPFHDEVILVTQKLEASQQATPVASLEAAGNCATTQSPELRFASSRPEPQDTPLTQAIKPLPISSQGSAATKDLPTTVADTHPKASPPIETQTPTLKEILPADTPASCFEPEIGQEMAAVQNSDVTFSLPESGSPPISESEHQSVEASPQPSSKTAVPSTVSDYRPLSPALPIARLRQPRSPNQPASLEKSADLRLRVQIIFGRSGGLKTLALVPDRREGMPDEIEITGSQGELHLAELRDDCYEPVPLVNASHALSQSVEWHGVGDARRWRWVLGGRELYVLAPGDEFGLSGFLSTARLRLNFPHAILVAERLRNEVLTALVEAGCASPELSVDRTTGVPSGWLLFRDVVPTRAVPMHEEAHILNALCPLSDIEPHFVGGIRLERRTWLAGFPPRLRLTGAFSDEFCVMIDGLRAQTVSDGAFEAPGWDDPTEHCLWFGGRTEMYALRTMDENWEPWNAHDFGRGAAICGAATYHVVGAPRHQVPVPVANPLLLGARPGEVFLCHARDDVHCETVLALPPFAPVWALPFDAAHADKQSARILLLHPIIPVSDIPIPAGNRTASRALLTWISAIRDAACKGLLFAVDSEESRVLWRSYRNAAKRLRRKMR